MDFGKFQRFALLSATVVVAIGAAGCGSKVARNADVSTGDYYSAEEFKKLSKDQRDAYCAALDAELANLEGAKGTADGQISSLRADLSGVQNELRQVQSRYDAKQGATAAVQEQINYFEGLPKMHVVEKGEFLQKISGYEAIYADPLKWPRIYRANKDRIKDPNLIYPGWELSIPRDWPSMWTVKQDEYLSKIAGYWEIYNKPSDWPKIYEANKGQIKDPDLIYPNWELSIPRN